MDVRLVDSHAHLNDGRFRQDMPQVLQRAKDAGVEAIINVGYDMPSSVRALSLAARYGSIYAAVGIHPHDAGTVPKDYSDELRKLAADKKVVAIGEIGLDFYRNLSSAADQKRVFREQLRLASELSLPVIVHDRDAHTEVLAILKEENAGKTGGVLHCFSGDSSFARRCLDLGFYISLAGPVTFKQHGDLVEVARMVPQNRLLLETDAPYLAPQPYRGKRNEPAYVRCVAEHVAKLRGQSLAELGAATAENATRLFGFKATAGRTGNNSV